MISQSFRAICPNTKTLQRFDVVSEKGKTMGWCPQCRQTFPLSELSDGLTESEAMKQQAEREAARRAQARERKQKR